MSLSRSVRLPSKFLTLSHSFYRSSTSRISQQNLTLSHRYKNFVSLSLVESNEIEKLQRYFASGAVPHWPPLPLVSSGEIRLTYCYRFFFPPVICGPGTCLRFLQEISRLLGVGSPADTTYRLDSVIAPGYLWDPHLRSTLLPQPR